MKVLHGTWIPNAEPDFIQPGYFYIWVEIPMRKRIDNQRIHPGHLTKDELAPFLVQELVFKESAVELSDRISSKYFALPTVNNQPHLTF